MLKKVITLVTVVAVVGLLSVAAAFASERTRVREDVAAPGGGVQFVEEAQLQVRLEAQDPLAGDDALRTRTREHVQLRLQDETGEAPEAMTQSRTRARAQLMSQDLNCLDCDGPERDRDRDRIHADTVDRPGPNGSRDCDGTGPAAAGGQQARRGGQS